MLRESSLARQWCAPQYAFIADVEVRQQSAPFWISTELYTHRYEILAVSS